MRNLHKLYYKDYYCGVDFAELDSDTSKNAIESSNELLTRPLPGNFLLDAGNHLGDGIYSFELEVLYPGLITGVGIQHQASVEGEFKLGLHFDYTTGLPVVYGSSVKGVLKSYFKDCISDLAKKCELDSDRLVDDIFEGKHYSDKEKTKSVYDRDVFFDAIISSPNKDRQILASDTIAPHGGESHDNPFVNPTPISFIKIASGVSLKFRFRLVDTKDDKGKTIFSKYDKCISFIDILTTFGIGAKTNVGYGQLKQTEATSNFLRKLMDNVTGERNLQVFGELIDAGKNHMNNGRIDEAIECFDQAENHANATCILTPENETVIRELKLKASLAKNQALDSTYDTYAEWIARVQTIGALLGNTKKWIKEGKAVDKEALSAKLAELREKVDKKELRKFEKGCYDLEKLIS